MVFHSLAILASFTGIQLSPNSVLQFGNSELERITADVRKVVSAIGPNRCSINQLGIENAIETSKDIVWTFSGGTVYVSKRTKQWHSIIVDHSFLIGASDHRTAYSTKSEADAICSKMFQNDRPLISQVTLQDGKFVCGLVFEKDGYPMLAEMVGSLSFKGQYQGAWYFKRPIRPKHFRNSPLRLTKPEALAKAKTIANQLASGAWQLTQDFEVGWDVPNFKERGIAFGLDYRTQADIEDGESDTARLVYHIFLGRDTSGRGISFAHVILDATTGEKLFVSRF